MHSIRTKITMMTLLEIVIVMFIATYFGVIAIKTIGEQSADKILLLMCENGARNLNHYFDSVEQSVEMVSAYVESDLDGLETEKLQAHLERVSNIFQKLSNKTFGILTYYYRIDPSISDTAKGFWYVNLNGQGFVKHDVTDISLYDTEDTSVLVWYTVPKATGKAVWLSPYITDNLDVRVISYNVPVYYEGTFIGVIGIELDYSSMADDIDSISLYKSGYAFLSDDQGNLFYHPHMDVATIKEKPTVPAGLISEERYVGYFFDGLMREAVWLPLENGMRLNVTVPVQEIQEGWQKWVNLILLIFSGFLMLIILVTLQATQRIVKPLEALTDAALQLKDGNYDVELEYSEQDEIGILTETFKNVTAHLKNYIGDLNNLAYADALTSLRNKGAFEIYLRELEEDIAETQGRMEFAVCIFDCNDLKQVNDVSGHDKGDIYLRETAAIICEVYDHSPVFRIGGDEFATLLRDRDYQNREALLELFDERCESKRLTETETWEKVNVARGMAVYDPAEDMSVNDVVRRADKVMYENKWRTKHVGEMA